MPRRETQLCIDEYYHVYNRGTNRERILFERENYRFFLKGLRAYISSKTASVLAYCLMPNHYHLLVRLLSSDFSETMQQFGTSFTKAINKRFDRAGPLFQSRFKAIHVEREEYLVHLSHYIHLNPVVAGLVKSPADWEFSSYREYAGLRDGNLPSPELILSVFPTRDIYRRFVETGSSAANPLIRDLLLD